MQRTYIMSRTLIIRCDVWDDDFMAESSGLPRKADGDDEKGAKRGWLTLARPPSPNP